MGSANEYNERTCIEIPFSAGGNFQFADMKESYVNLVQRRRRWSSYDKTGKAKAYRKNIC